MDARLKLIELYSNQRIAELQEKVKSLEAEIQRLKEQNETEKRYWVLRLADFHAAVQKSKQECGLDD